MAVQPPATPPAKNCDVPLYVPKLTAVVKAMNSTSRNGIVSTGHLVHCRVNYMAHLHVRYVPSSCAAAFSFLQLLLNSDGVGSSDGSLLHFAPSMPGCAQYTKTPILLLSAREHAAVVCMLGRAGLFFQGCVDGFKLCTSAF